MLAYMDDLLEPSDAQMIEKKIEQSEFATNLMHRIRDVMRRIRLAAPSVHEQGAGLDPNTVAEYLDNTLHDARVPDFEKVCLESDLHLAEVASCHQVLALVLGEPAEVDPLSRQRMYHLPQVMAAKAKAAPPRLPDAAQGDGDHLAGHDTERPAVPDYLRDGWNVRRMARIAAIAAALVVIAGGLLAATGQFQSGSWLMTTLGAGPGDSPLAQAPDERPGPESEPTVVGEKAGPEPGGPLPTVPPTAPDPKLPDAASKVASAPAAPGSPASPQANSEANPLRTAASPTAAPPGTAEKPTTALGQQRPANVESRLPGSETPKVAMVMPPLGPVKKPSATGTPETAPVPVEQVGHYVSDGVLLRAEPNGNWRRLEANSAVNSQDRLLALPGAWPVLQLVGGIHLQLIDGARVDLRPLDAQKAPGLVVHFGRFLIRGEGKAGNRLRLVLGNRSGSITLSDPDSVAGLAAERQRVAGVDPELQPLPLAGELYAVAGRMLWQEAADREPSAINAPVRVVLNDKPLEAVAVQQFPRWITPELPSSLSSRAAATLEMEIREKPLEQTLHELTDYRRTEVRWLAMRALGFLGDYQPVVSALADPLQRSVWPEYVEHLREALRRDSDTARAVHATMQKIYGGQGDELYRLLWAYPDDPAALDGQQTAELIRYLDHENLALRVVSFITLKRITGLGLFYVPHETPARRATSIARWKERLLKPTLTGPSSKERAKPAGAEIVPSTDTKPATERVGPESASPLPKGGDD